MNTKLIAGAVGVASMLGLTTVASAATEFDWYGSIRAGAIYSDSDTAGQDGVWDLGATGSDGELGGQGIYSRIGVKGSTDLGGGSSAGFQVEQGVKNGLSGRLHNVWLGGSWGKLTLGQQGNPYRSARNWDQTYFLGGQVGSDDGGSRIEGIKFASDLSGPFNFSVMATGRDTETTPGIDTTTTTDTTSILTVPFYVCPDNKCQVEVDGDGNVIGIYTNSGQYVDGVVADPVNALFVDVSTILLDDMGDPVQLENPDGTPMFEVDGVTPVYDDTAPPYIEAGELDFVTDIFNTMLYNYTTEDAFSVDMVAVTMEPQLDANGDPVLAENADGTQMFDDVTGEPVTLMNSFITVEDPRDPTEIIVESTSTSTSTSEATSTTTQTEESGIDRLIVTASYDAGPVAVNFGHNARTSDNGYDNTAIAVNGAFGGFDWYATYQMASDNTPAGNDMDSFGGFGNFGLGEKDNLYLYYVSHDKNSGEAPTEMVLGYSHKFGDGASFISEYLSLNKDTGMDGESPKTLIMAVKVDF